MCMVVKTRLLLLDGFHDLPPILSFLDSVQFQSPPTMSAVSSVLLMIQFLSSCINSS